MYIFVVFCLHVTKSKHISNICKLMRQLQGAFCEHVVFAAAQREQAKRASYNYGLRAVFDICGALLGCSPLIHANLRILFLLEFRYGIGNPLL